VAPPAPGEGASLKGTRPAWFEAAGPARAEVHARDRIPPGAVIAGPAILEQSDATTLVPPGWAATALEHGALLIARGEDSP
jgi:N-methylhydantoinase A